MPISTEKMPHGEVVATPKAVAIVEVAPPTVKVPLVSILLPIVVLAAITETINKVASVADEINAKILAQYGKGLFFSERGFNKFIF